MYGSKMLIEYYLKALVKVCHQSAKRGRLKVHPGVLNDNLIK
jgi:hypothetical protein